MFDFTQVGPSPQVRPETQPVQQNHPQAVVRESENHAIPQNEEAKEFRRTHWTPDKFAQDGQVMAGEPDDAYREALKNTEWAD